MDANLVPRLRQANPRRHPWTAMARDPRCQYYDFVAQPELVSEVLEDFVSFADRPQLDPFFAFLRWLNGDASIFRSNDCGATPPERDGGWHRWQGRLMMLFRYIPRNLVEADCRALLQTALERARAKPLNYRAGGGRIGLVLDPALFDDVPGGVPGTCYEGHQLTVHFQVWAPDRDAMFENFGALFTGVQAWTREVNDALRRVTADGFV